LEYGCGNGRVTLAMAQAGARVWGVDLSRPMLNDFENRLSKAYSKLRERITLVYGDMRELELAERFSLILAPFNVMLHLYSREDIEHFLEKVKSHLLPDGRFVCDVSVPQVTDLARNPAKRYKAPSFQHPETSQKINYSERFEYDPVRQLLLVWMEFVPEDGSEPWVVPLTHRQYFPCELESHFYHAGFSSVKFTSDFSDGAPHAQTDSLIVTCQT
jgi:SAM-dependent methyltransferase